MMFPAYLSKKKVADYQHWGTIFLPDFIIYDFSAAQYQKFWEKISSTPRKYLYTDGFNVIKVSWFRAAFESLKGFLGFKNHCDTHKIEMTLGKIAYAGYVKGFQAPALETMDSFIDSDFKHLLNLPKSTDNLKSLQKALINFYCEQATYISANNYLFGEGLIDHYELIALLPTLAPQNKEVLARAISQMVSANITPRAPEQALPGPFAKMYAAELVKKFTTRTGASEYRKALSWDPEVAFEFKELFINFYLAERATDPHALPQALVLMEELANSSNETQRLKAVALVKNIFSPEEQQQLLGGYPQLKKIVAQSYLNSVQEIKKQPSLVKLFWQPDYFPQLAHAAQLAPEILEDPNYADPLLQEEWTIHQFGQAITEKRFKEAELIYQKNPQFKFSKKDLLSLQTYYHAEWNTNKETLRIELLYGRTNSLKTLAQQQIELARKITRMQGADHEGLVAEALLGYASILLQSDQINHPAVREADLDELSAAQKHLGEHHFLNGNSQFIELSNQLIWRKIECLIARLGVPVNCDRELARLNFGQEHAVELKALQDSLNQFIALNQSNNKTEIRAKLAKAHYLMADSMLFFESKKGHAIPHFKKAMELMPNNIYYQMQYYRLINHERYIDWARGEIEKKGHHHFENYEAYMLERWNEQKIMSAGFDIHAVTPLNGMWESFLYNTGFSY